MRKVIYFAFAGALVLAGCGDGSVSLSTSSSSSSGGTGAGGAGGAACVAASISVDGDGPTNHFGAACKGSYGAAYTTHANGYLDYPEAGSALQLLVNGCAKSDASPMFGSLSLLAPQTGVGSVTMGTASYANGTDTFTTDTAVTLTVTELDGMLVTGSYTATVNGTIGGMKMLSGAFSVCRVPNSNTP